MRKTDVVIIGGGAVGTAIAHAFARYQVDVVLLEKEAELASGTSKANSGIVHSGYHCAPGSAKARLCVRGNRMMRRLAPQLHVPFRVNGSLTIASTEEESVVLESWLQHGRQNGVPGLRLVGPRTLRRLEPGLSDNVRGALFAPTGGIISPFELVFALGENAAANGVEIVLQAPVVDIRETGERLEVITPAETFLTRLAVNAAGLGAGSVARLVGDESVVIKPRRGEEYLLDKAYGELVTRTIFPTATGYSKGILIIPTVEGNLMLGPTDVPEPEGSHPTTTAAGYDEIIGGTRRLMPTLPGSSAVIGSFAGLRASSHTGDFVVRPSTVCPKLIHAAGVDSPGLTAAPAIAEEVVGYAATLGLQLRPKRRYVRGRPEPIRFRDLSDEERSQLAAGDPAYRHVVCRCELVTEAEIVDAIRRGARTLDGVKLRTRAGMGRCQGGFCSPKVLAVLSRELGVPYTAITKRGPGSEIVLDDLNRAGGEADATRTAG